MSATPFSHLWRFYMSKEVKESKDDLFLSTGSTLVNCACSDRHDGGFKSGTISTVCGGSSSGKTILMLTAMAEAAHDKKFDDYRLIYDDGESALNFDIERLFGKKTKERLESPLVGDDGVPINSNTVDDFKAMLVNLCNSGEKFVYVLDSLDSLTSSEEVDREFKNSIKIAKAMGNRDEIKDIKTGYQLEKSKKIGQALRNINSKIKETDSFLIILQQLRVNINPNYGEPTEITSGGKSPFYYSSHQIRMKASSKIKVSSTDETQIGHNTRINIVKNKITGKKREAVVSIYESYGMDDISSCLDFLISKGFVKNLVDKKGAVKKQSFNIPEFKISGTKKNIIKQIEDDGLHCKLSELTGKCWNKYEDSIEIKRVKRYE